MSGIKNLFKKIKAKNNNHWLTSSLADSTGRVTKSIDDHLQKKADNQSQTLNILLLGAGGSGKSTIMKQMARMYNEGSNNIFKIPEYRQIILRSIHINIMYDIIDLCKHYLILKSQLPDLRLENSELELIALRVVAEYMIIDDYSLTTDFATDIKNLWFSPVFRKVFDIRKKGHIMDNVPYFFGNIMQYASSNYRPTFEDYIRVRDRTTGINSCKFQVRRWAFQVTDVGGQRSERRKWLKVLDNINVVFYVMSLAAYDQVLFEDNTQRCWDETFSLFEQTINHKAFRSTDFIVFLNKCDIFADKIKKVSFMKYINGGHQRDEHLAIAGNANNYRADAASFAIKNSHQTANVVINKRFSNGRFQKQLKLRSHESFSINGTNGHSLKNLVMGEKSDFNEVDGHSGQAVSRWAKQRFVDIFHASHGGKNRYLKNRSAHQRTINFHVTCATDEQQIQTVINIVEMQMLKRVLNRNLLF